MGNWDSYQITQLNHVVQPTDSEQALSECLLTLSKHLVNRIDSIRAARLQAAYFRAFSRGRSTHGPRSPTPLFQTSVGSCFPTICFLCGTPGGHGPGTSSSWKEAKPHTIGIYSDVKRFSTRKKAEDFMAKSTGPGDRYSRTQPLSCSPMVLHFPTARQAGEFTSLSLAQMRLKRFGDWLSRPLPAPPGLVPCGPPATQGNLAPSTKPSLGSERDACLYSRTSTKALCHPLHQTRGQQASHRPDSCPTGPSQTGQ